MITWKYIVFPKYDISISVSFKSNILQKRKGKETGSDDVCSNGQSTTSEEVGFPVGKRSSSLKDYYVRF